MERYRRVVVTGTGCISPVGNTTKDTFEALLAGKSGIRRVTRFDAAEFDCQVAGEVRDFDFDPYVSSKREARRMDTFCRYAIAASDMALAESGLQLAERDAERAGTYIGTGVGGLQVIEAQHRTLLEGGPRRVSPFLIPMFLGNLAAGHLAIRHQLKGPSVHVSTACATGTHALGEAAAVIARDDADVMLAGASEAGITPLLFAGFCAANAMSSRNAEPTAASRPFERQRDGFVMGEGAGIVVLEELQHAKRRGARILAEVVGYGQSSDAGHVTAPDESGAGAVRSMVRALARAELDPRDVDYINAHGTATPLGDKMECTAVQQVFGEHASSGKLWLSSTKSMIGHLLGASGAVEAIVCIQSIIGGKVHPTINLDEPDPACALEFVPHAARERRVRVALSNSFGFGGHNATLALREFTG